MRFLAGFMHAGIVRGVLLLNLVVFGAAQQEPVKLTLAQAIDLALKNNHELAIGRDKVVEMISAKHVTTSDYYPKISNSSSYLHYTETSVLQFTRGSFGSFPGLGELPSTNLIVNQGEVDHVLSISEIAQPISQLIKIHDAHRAARADEAAARENLESLRNQVALVVRQLYYGLLAVRLDQKTAAEQIHVAEEQLSESEQDVYKGNELEVTVLGAKTTLLQAKQDELTARIRNSDLLAQFNDVIGLPQSAQVQLEDQDATPVDLPVKEECIRLAQSAAPEIKSAEETVRKAEAGVAAARAEFIPDITAFGRHEYQNGIAFLFHNYGEVGFGLTYTLFDGGKKRAMITERQAQRAQALDNLRRLKDESAVNVEKAFDKIDQSRNLIDVAKQAVALREEGDRLANVQLGYGVLVNSKRSEATAALAKARADLLKAELGYRESQAELSALIGRLPR
jgi:outer membrane protein TolC